MLSPVCNSASLILCNLQCSKRASIQFLLRYLYLGANSVSVKMTVGKIPSSESGDKSALLYVASFSKF